MVERYTVPQLRTLFGFDLIILARASGLEVATVYKALLRQPIGRDEAQRLMHGLRHVTGVEWTQENLDIVLWEDQLLLWVARATMHPVDPIEEQDKYLFLYARDKTHAEELTKSWKRQLVGTHPYGNIISSPYGYRAGKVVIPGYLVSPDLKEKESES